MRDIVLLGARISAGIVFSLVAAGWLGQSGANLVDAAESILQTSKPASEAHPRSVTFSGEVLKGRSFEKTIRANLFFRLVPQELGWTILIGSKADAANNFCGVVTPPYRGINALQIEGWHFRNSDNTGPNEAGPKNVNAPQELREFYFVLSEADYRNAMDALQIMLWPYSYSKQQIDRAERAHSKLRKGNGTMTIRDLKLNTLEPRKQAGIERATFNVALLFP
jgi:hypothetical protein